MGFMCKKCKKYYLDKEFMKLPTQTRIVAKGKKEAGINEV